MSEKLTYAIGDVHGRSDLLNALVTHCINDADSLGATPKFIFLGDICDYGNDTLGAYDTVADMLALYPESELVRGNHDALFEMSVGQLRPDAVKAWLERGGIETLNSYHPGDPELAVHIINALHSDHIRMVQNSPYWIEQDGFLFVHAGIDPHKPLTLQTEQDLLWVREPFLNHIGDLGSIVVHGHTPCADLPVVTENRISLDTGAYGTGRLTALKIDGSDLTFFQTDGTPEYVRQVDPILLDRGYGTCMDINANGLTFAA